MLTKKTAYVRTVALIAPNGQAPISLVMTARLTVEEMDVTFTLEGDDNIGSFAKQMGVANILDSKGDFCIVVYDDGVDDNTDPHYSFDSVVKIDLSVPQPSPAVKVAPV